MKRWADGGIILSSVASRYQLGLLFQAGSLISPPSASTPHQNHRAILFVNNELRRRYIASQRNGRILDYRDIVVILLQQAVDTFPT